MSRSSVGETRQVPCSATFLPRQLDKAQRRLGWLQIKKKKRKLSQCGDSMFKSSNTSDPEI